MISVIIPTYNRSQTLGRACESVLGQSYRSLELIVVDDGSTDDTEEVVEALEDPRVRYVRVPNGGACRARNRGIELAQGDLVAFQDSDDVWRPYKLESQLAALERYKADVCFCKLERHGYREGVLKVVPSLPGGPVSRSELVSASRVSTQTLLAKTDVMRRHPFDPGMPRLQDYEWSIRASEDACFVLDPSVLVDVFLQGDSISASSNADKELRAYARIVEKHPELAQQEPEAFEDLLLHQALVQERSGRSGEDAIRAALAVNGSPDVRALLLLRNLGLARRGRCARLYHI